MSTFAIKADRFVLPGATMRGGYLTIAEGKFVGWSEETPDCEIHDLTGCIVGPGLVDTHIHGFYNHATTDREAAGINASSVELARRGTTCWLPTTFTESVEQVADSCAAIAAADEGRARAPAVIAAVPPVGECDGVLGLDARYIDTQRFVKSQLAGNFNAAAQLTGALGLDDRHLRGQGGRTSVSDFGPVRGEVRIALGQQPGDGVAFRHRHAVRGPEADIAAAAEACAAIALDTQGRPARDDRLLGHVQAAAAHADAVFRARDVDAAVDIGATFPGSVQALARTLDDRVAVQIELLVVISFNGGSRGPYLSRAADVGFAFKEKYARIVGCDPSAGDV